jgi:hypothetical protein
MIHFKNADNSLSYTSYVAISDSLLHGTVSVHLYQQCLFIMKCQIKPNHIYCLSEGSAAQYKNKKDFIGLCFHEDSSITAEWHLCATSQEKRVYDGVAGTVKWQDACASLQ